MSLKNFQIDSLKTKTFHFIGLVVFGIFLIGSSSSSYGYDTGKPKERLAHQTPAELEGVGIDEKLGDQVDLDLKFFNEEGELVSLGSLTQNSKPTLLTIVYYDCPSLCNLHLKGVVESLNHMDWEVGREFNLVAISMDHTEIPELAKDAKLSYQGIYEKTIRPEGWHFLTGSKENVAAIAGQVGFGFRWDPRIQEYAHASAAYILTPDGQISRYLYGIELPSQTTKLSLLEASQGEVGTVIDRLILFCYQFDPTKNKYTLYAFNIMRVGAILVLLVIAGFLLPAWFRERKPKPLKGEV